ncbi:hypothetical protein ES703_73161 [subsurface metagenome]
MPKREEIREIIDTYTDDGCFYPTKNCKLCKGGYCISTDDAYKCLMKRLGEVGVVMKVEDDTLELIEVAGGMYPVYKGVAKGSSGFFEPLIKEDEKK